MLVIIPYEPQGVVDARNLRDLQEALQRELQDLRLAINRLGSGEYTDLQVLSADPADPPAGYLRCYSKNDGTNDWLYFKDSSGNVRKVDAT